MFFKVRALACIALITGLAIHRLPAGPDVVPAAMPSGATAVHLLGEACQSRPDICLSALKHGLGSASGGVGREDPPMRPKRAPAAQSGHLPVALGGSSLT